MSVSFFGSSRKKKPQRRAPALAASRLVATLRGDSAQRRGVASGAGASRKKSGGEAQPGEPEARRAGLANTRTAHHGPRQPTRPPKSGWSWPQGKNTKTLPSSRSRALDTLECARPLLCSPAVLRTLTRESFWLFSRESGNDCPCRGFNVPARAAGAHRPPPPGPFDRNACAQVVAFTRGPLSWGTQRGRRVPPHARVSGRGQQDSMMGRRRRQQRRWPRRAHSRRAVCNQVRRGVHMRTTTHRSQW